MRRNNPLLYRGCFPRKKIVRVDLKQTPPGTQFSPRIKARQAVVGSLEGPGLRIAVLGRRSEAGSKEDSYKRDTGNHQPPVLDTLKGATRLALNDFFLG